MINIIVARNNNNSIGKDNKLLYHIKEDMKRFKQLTIGHTIIMGSKTFLSLPNVEPLKGRENIVLTRHEKDFIYIVSNKHPNKEFDNLTISDDINYLLDYYKNSKEEIFIIGGELIYKQFLPYTNKIYLTQIDDNKVGDSYFEFDKNDFELEEFEERITNEGLVYRFENYIRK